MMWAIGVWGFGNGRNCLKYLMKEIGNINFFNMLWFASFLFVAKYLI